MEKENNKVDFSNQEFYIGIDVHNKQWNVTILSEGMILRTMSVPPSIAELVRYMERQYPNGKYHSVYEAGYSGFWIDEGLKELGVKNIVVNAADIPTRSSERIRKTDSSDSRKLARELSNGTLKGIYIPEKAMQSLRTLNRLRQQYVKELVRLKTRIKAHLRFYGKPIPETSDTQHWSKSFIEKISKTKFEHKAAKYCLEDMLDHLEVLKERINKILRELKELLPKEIITDRLMSVPGVGFITATSFYCEIIDITRFNTLDSLASYIGLVPSVYSSGEKEKVLGVTHRKKKYLRELLIEAAWVATRKDPVLLQKYGQLKQRMCGSKAIVNIAKKLLARMRYVWLNDKPYIPGIIK